MRKAVLVVAILSGVALAAIKSYEVVPCSSYIARTDTAPGLNKVTQYFRMTVDSLWKVSVWVGNTANSRMVAGSWLLVGGRVGQTACAAEMQA